MATLPKNRRAVKRKNTQSEAATLGCYIDAHIEAANALAAEMEIYKMWLTHGLVPAAHIVALMGAEAGGRH